MIQCTYKYPSRQTVREVKWFKVTFKEIWRVSNPKFEFVGNLRNNCSLRINNIDRVNEGFYIFRFETNRDSWTSQSLAIVTVTDLVASVASTTVTEGDNVTLTCRSGCSSQTDIQPVWFREGQLVRSTRFTASREDAGRYICNPQGQPQVKSNTVTLNVKYAPKNVQMSMTPSEDVVLGSKLELSCSSEANPSVTDKHYSWFKDGHHIGYGQNHIIPEVQLSDSGQYQCQAWNQIYRNGRMYFQSSKADVIVQYPPMNVSVSVDSDEVPEGSDVNMTCRSDALPSASNYSWYRVDSDLSSMVLVGSGPVLSLSPVETSDSGRYMCTSRNKHGESNSTELLLSVTAKEVSAMSVSAWAGVGVGALVLVVLVLVLLLYWKSLKRHSRDQTTEFRQRPSSSASVEMVDHIYANTRMFHDDRTDADHAYPEVFYTTVTIKPKNPRRQTQILTDPEQDQSVIYATISKSS